MKLLVYSFYALALGIFPHLAYDSLIEHYEKANQLANNGHYNEAWKIYKTLMDQNIPDSMLCGISGFMGKYAGTGELSESDSRKMAEKTREICKELIKREPECIDARINYVVSIGHLSELEWSPKKKYKYALDVKREAHKIIELDPVDPRGYYILGKWAQILGSVSGFGKFIIDSFLGGIPKDATLENARDYYKSAIKRDPDYILFRYALSSVYDQTGKRDSAIQQLNIALDLPLRESEDVIRKKQCTDLLTKLSEK